MPNDQNDSRKVMTFKEAPPWLRHSTLKCHTLFSRIIIQNYVSLCDANFKISTTLLLNNKTLCKTFLHILRPGGDEQHSGVPLLALI